MRPEHGVRRKLLPRHLNMIAIGGTIGTGYVSLTTRLFVGGGAAIAYGGPLGALIGYCVVSVLVYSVVTSIGEMASFRPVSGSFNTYAGNYVDSALAFALGWNYWLQWAVSLPSELSAAGIIIQYWSPESPSWLWSLLLLAILSAVHFGGVHGFGEVEFYLSAIKVVAIIIFIIVGTLLDLGILGPAPIFFDFWSISESPIKNGFIGIYQVFLLAFFSFGGTELIGLTAGEAFNPQVNVPKAINHTFYRILLFYLGSIFIMGLVIRHDDPTLPNSAKSGDITIAPFTLIFSRSGLNWASHLMNGVIFTAVLSAGNSAIYAASRTLMALSQENKAPLIFSKLNSNDVPIYSLAASFVIGCLSFLSIFYGSGTVFTYLLNLTSVSGIVTWIMVAIIHIRFRAAFKAQKKSIENLPYRAPFYPLGPYIAIFLGSLILIGQGVVVYYTNAGFWGTIQSYFGILLFLSLFLYYKYTYNTCLIPLTEIDLEEFVESEYTAVPEDILDNETNVE